MKTKRTAGAPAGNGNALKHGYYSLISTLNKGHLDKRTMLGRYQMEKERELATALGGDPSPQQEIIIRDTIRTLLYLGSIDAYLINLKSAVRRGKLHPVMGERVKLAAHIRENLRTIGLHRRVKTPSLTDLLTADNEPLTTTNGTEQGNDSHGR